MKNAYLALHIEINSICFASKAEERTWIRHEVSTD